MVRSRGRERKSDYVTSWGEVVEGAYLSADGRLRPIGKSSPAFGPAHDERLAVHKFKQWKATQEGSSKLEPLDGYSQVVDLQAVKDAEKQKIRNLILTDPKQAALYLDIPFLSEYPVVHARPEFTLDALCNHYLENKRNEFGKPLHRKYRDNTKRAIAEFLKQTGVVYASGISREVIQSYKATIQKAFDAGASAAWVRTRYVALKTLLNYGFEISRDKEDYRKALDECACLKSPSTKPNPKPIPVSDFHKLHAFCNRREQVMLLLGLNACMHGGEVCKLKKAEVDLQAGTLISTRSKNGYPRVAKLWARTVKALRDWLKDNPNQSEYVFVSKNGAPMESENLRQRIVEAGRKAQQAENEQAEKAGRKPVQVISDDTTFEGLRDAAFTIAEECDAHHAKFLAGHKTGQSDSYVFRMATNKKVVACCQAIEKAFFKS